MLDRRITFGGDVIPARIASDPHIIRASRKMSVTQIAGSNREIVDMEDAWECYNQPYRLFIGNGSEDSIQEALLKVSDVLCKKGWQILEDEYEPDIFRLAYYQGGLDAENRYTRLGVFDISFRCRPERFLLTGNYPTSIPTGSKLTNPTLYKAKPLIHITGSGSGTLTIGNTQMSFTDMVDYLNIDCETEDVYRLPSENRNNLMEGNFPILDTGENLVTFSSGISSVTITPRYWTI